MPRSEDVALAVHGLRTGGQGSVAVAWQIAEEAPVAFSCNGRQRLVMMATPSDLEDFAIGLALTEGFVESAGVIDAIRVAKETRGMVVDLSVDPAHLARARVRRKALEGRSGCGICGIASLDDLPAPRRRPGACRPIAPSAMLRGLRGLHDHQPGNARCRSLHAAAWCDREGVVLLAREDVGRHNALDKLLGALARGGVHGDGFVVMSSRCSFELVQKIAMRGIATLATVSAPTALALRLASAGGITLAALSGDAVVVFDPYCMEAAA